jgi:DNA gyrase subunit A
MLISNKGTLVRIRVDEVSVLSRNTQGVRLIKLKKDELLVGVEPVADAADELPDDVVEELVEGAVVDDEPQSGEADNE